MHPLADVHGLRRGARNQGLLASVRSHLHLVWGAADPDDQDAGGSAGGGAVSPVHGGADGLGGIRAPGVGAAGAGLFGVHAIGTAWIARPADPDETPLSPAEAMYLLPTFRAARGLED